MSSPKLQDFNPNATPFTSTRQCYPSPIKPLYERSPSLRTAPSVPPGFKGVAREPHVTETSMRVALLEQELLHQKAQKEEAGRVTSLLQAELKQLTARQHTEAERVFVLVQELDHCERRTAKAEIGVEYLSERNVEIAAKLKRQENPGVYVTNLEAQLRDARQEMESKMVSLEVEIQCASRDNSILKAKLENAMDTIIAISALPKGSDTYQANHTAGTDNQHNNLIDLLGDSMTPTKYDSSEEQKTLLDESYDPEEEELVLDAQVPQASSESFDSDFSNSSYIIRFKGIRDMTKRAEYEDLAHASTIRRAKDDTSRHKSSNSVPRFVTPTSDGIVSESTSPNTYSTHEPADKISLKVGQAEQGVYRDSTSELNKALYSWPASKDRLAPETISPAQTAQHAITKLAGAGKPSHLPPPEAFPIFRYGIRFNAVPDERDVYRTIIISNLSSDITLLPVLDRVKGGAVLEANLLDTSRITGSKSVMIKFVHEDAALGFKEYTKGYPIVINGFTAVVTALKTPTWPMKASLRKAVFDHQQTRCLEVHNFPSDISPKMLLGDLQICRQMKTTWIVYKELTKDGILKLQFSSVDQAGHAFGVLSQYRRYKGAIVYVVPDTCAQPLESLGDTVNRSVAPMFMPSEQTLAHPAETFKQAFPRSVLMKNASLGWVSSSQDIDQSTDEYGRLSKDTQMDEQPRETTG